LMSLLVDVYLIGTVLHVSEVILNSNGNYLVPMIIFSNLALMFKSEVENRRVLIISQEVWKQPISEVYHRNVIPE
jgi:hypothetical protein